MSTDGFTPEMWDQWVTDNPWFGQDAELTECANRLSRRVREESPEPVGLAYYNKVKELVKEQHPDAFADETEEPVEPTQEPAPTGHDGAMTEEPPETAKEPASCGRALSEMTAEDFKAWLGRLGLSQREAARRLGISERQVAYYVHDQKKVALTDALAVEALEWRKDKEKLRQAFRLLGEVSDISDDGVAAPRARNGGEDKQIAAS